MTSIDSLLPTIWFLLWGLLWAIYFALDGFDLGAGMLAGILKPSERRSLISSLGPFWDGNEVWLITAGGVTFAAFPKLYAVMFSSFYAPLMIILLALILRAVAIEFFHLQDTERWQRIWTGVLAGASTAVALLFGVAFGNIFQGLPLDQAGYHGTLLSLLNPYGVLTGLLFVLAFFYNGSAWLAHKAVDSNLREKGFFYARRTWPLLLLTGAAWLVYTPLATGLEANFLALPLLLFLPLAAVAALVVSRFMVGEQRPGTALVLSSLTVLGLVLAAVLGLYPNMFPSSLDPAATLTAFNSSSSTYTLKFMLGVTVVFLPFVLFYQVWFYRIFGRASTREEAGYQP